MNRIKMYIRMCEKAKQIQELRDENCNETDTREWNNGDYYANKQDMRNLNVDDVCIVGLQYMSVCGGFGIHGDESSSYDKRYPSEGDIFLPTRKQLQEMSGLSWWKFDKRCNEIRRCLLEDPLIKIEVKTKEEAGMCVVMGKYNEVWNGEDWIKGD